MKNTEKQTKLINSDSKTVVENSILPQNTELEQLKETDLWERLEQIINEDFAEYDAVFRALAT
jgi:hypothetical protein